MPAAAADPVGLPTETARRYDADSNGTSATLGNLTLSRTAARFSRLKGEMKLRHAGVRPSTGAGDTEFTGDVYEVLNPDAFFAPNRGKNGFCGQPVRWVTVRALPGSPEDGRIRLGLLTIADWKAYDPSKPGACSADSFALR